MNSEDRRRHRKPLAVRGSAQLRHLGRRSASSRLWSTCASQAASRSREGPLDHLGKAADALAAPAERGLPPADVPRSDGKERGVLTPRLGQGGHRPRQQAGELIAVAAAVVVAAAAADRSLPTATAGGAAGGLIGIAVARARRRGWASRRSHAPPG